MKNKTSFKIVPLLILLLLIVIYLIFVGTNKEGNNNTETLNIPKNSISISKNVVIAPVSNKVLNTKTQGTSTNLYAINTETKKKQLLYSSNIPMEITNLGKTNKIFKDQGKSLFVAYQFTELPQKDKKIQKKNETGFIFAVDKDGRAEKIYTTEHIFDSAKNEDGQLVVYEKILLDDMNVYPSYYKPYIKVKKVYKNGEFVEVERKEINATK